MLLNNLNHFKSINRFHKLRVINIKPINNIINMNSEGTKTFDSIVFYLIVQKFSISL